MLELKSSHVCVHGNKRDDSGAEVSHAGVDGNEEIILEVKSSHAGGHGNERDHSTAEVSNAGVCRNGRNGL